ncbi:MAG: iron chaperone [Minisyncoccia bacterium]
MKSIDEYHQNQSKSMQPQLELLRQIIKEVAPEAREIISYSMPAFKQNQVLVYYALNKNHIGFYPTPSPILHFQKELKSYKTSKAAIQFPLDQPLPIDLIQKIVKFRIKEDKNL